MSTKIFGHQINDGTITKDKLNVTINGQSVITKIIDNNFGIKVSTSSGADSGTGEVSLYLDLPYLEGRFIKDNILYGNASADTAMSFSNVGRNENGLGGNLQGSPLLSLRTFDTGLQISGGYINDILRFRGYHTLSGFTAWRDIWHNGNFNPALKANDADVVHKTGNITEFITGNKYFDNGFVGISNAGSAIGLFSSTDKILGTGSQTDINAYVYGNNPFAVWTNAVKRLTINGDGSSQFTGTVAGLDATASNHFLTKGQFDTVNNDLVHKSISGFESETGISATNNNLNDILKTSVHLFNGPESGTLNIPFSYGSVFSKVFNSTYIIQEADDIFSFRKSKRYKTSPTTWSNWVDFWHTDNLTPETVTNISNPKFNNENLVKSTAISNDSSEVVTSAGPFVTNSEYLPINLYNVFVPNIGKKLTISFDAKVAIAGPIQLYILGRCQIGYHTFNLTTEYTRHTITVDCFDNNPTDTYSNLSFYGTYGTGVIPTVKNLMITEGIREFNHSIHSDDLLTNTIRTENKLGALVVGTNNQNNSYPSLGTFNGKFAISKNPVGSNDSYGLNFGITSAGASWLQSQFFYGSGTPGLDLSLNPAGGNVGIGVLNATAKLEIVSSTGNAFNVMNGSLQNLFSVNTGGQVTVSDLLSMKFGVVSDYMGIGIYPTGVHKLHVEGGTIYGSSNIIAGTGTDGGFENAHYTLNSHNNIWRFTTAPEYGIGYYQNNASGNDHIGFHFGNRNAPKFIFDSLGKFYVNSIEFAGSVPLRFLGTGLDGTMYINGLNGSGDDILAITRNNGNSYYNFSFKGNLFEYNSRVWTQDSLTNNNQLTNGSNYQSITGIVQRLTIEDRRALNILPSGFTYKEAKFDFIDINNLGGVNYPIINNSVYGHILTVNGWESGTGGGGNITQVGFGDSLAVRNNVDGVDTAWGPWKKLVYEKGDWAFTKLTAKTFSGDIAEVSTSLTTANINGISSGHIYKWYSDEWRLGIKRGDSGSSIGFGFNFNGVEKVRFTSDGNIDTVASGNSTIWNDGVRKSGSITEVVTGKKYWNDLQINRGMRESSADLPNTVVTLHDIKSIYSGISDIVSPIYGKVIIPINGFGMWDLQIEVFNFAAAGGPTNIILDISGAYSNTWRRNVKCNNPDWVEFVEFYTQPGTDYVTINFKIKSTYSAVTRAVIRKLTIFHAIPDQSIYSNQANYTLQLQTTSFDYTGFGSYFQVLNSGFIRDSFYSKADGSNASGFWPITSGASETLNVNDGPRNLTDRLPNWKAKSAKFDFVDVSAISGATGYFGGVMTVVPFNGTTASNGDSSYQLAFINKTGINGAGVPGLKLRKGIDTTWGTWYDILTSNDATNFITKNTNDVKNSKLLISNGTVTADFPSLGSLANTQFVIGNGNATDIFYGLAFGTNVNGNSWLQNQRFDISTAVYNLEILPLGAGKVIIGGSSEYNSSASIDYQGKFNVVSDYELKETPDYERLSTINNVSAINYFGKHEFVKRYTEGLDVQSLSFLEGICTNSSLPSLEELSLWHEKQIGSQKFIWGNKDLVWLNLNNSGFNIFDNGTDIGYLFNGVGGLKYVSGSNTLLLTDENNDRDIKISCWADSSVIELSDTSMAFTTGQLDVNALMFKTGNEQTKLPTTNNIGHGEIVKFGTGTTTVGYIYQLNSSGAWVSANNGSSGVNGNGLLGIAMGTSPSTHGMLIRGYIRHTNFNLTIGAKIYLASGGGLPTSTIPTTSGSIVRIIGYIVPGTNTMYFNPDNTYVENN